MNNPEGRITAPALVLILAIVVLVPLLPLLISRQWDWWEAWLFASIFIVVFAASRILAARHHPGLIAERARLTQHEDAQPWDRLLVPMTALGSASIPVVAGFDALLNWSPPVGPAAKAVSLVLFLAGNVLASYALIENRYFSGVVRLQRDRGHQVVSSGPYRWIRHPGYAGALVTYLATPVLLDALWALILAFFLAIVLVVRTALEDQFLRAQLDGYAEYARRVRYRLLPGLW